MPLEVNQNGNAQWVVRGVTTDPQVIAPLGRNFKVLGPHVMGFDDNFAEPVIVRAYYDPSRDQGRVERARGSGTLDHVGYMQFMQISFGGCPIRPEEYGGRLADRGPYVSGDDLLFVDFMGPAQANANGIETPLYSYNGKLVRGGLNLERDFFRHPLPNGSLYKPLPPLERPGPEQSLAASMYAEISLGLLTPGDIVRYLVPQRQIGEPLPVTREDLARNETYRLALNRLEAPGGRLEGLDETQVTAQVIGDYVLLTLPDPEDFCPTLVISTRPRQDGGSDVLVHLITDYDMESMLLTAGQDTLDRISKRLAARDVTVCPPVRRGRGHSGLLAPPFSFLPGTFPLQLRYWTVAVAVGLRVDGSSLRRFLSGFTWTALFQFDEDTGLLTFAAVGEPELIDGFALADHLKGFKRALETSAGATIDVSNFTKAAMVRDNFGVDAGAKLRFLDRQGRDVG